MALSSGLFYQHLKVQFFVFHASFIIIITTADNNTLVIAKFRKFRRQLFHSSLAKSSSPSALDDKTEVVAVPMTTLGGLYMVLGHILRITLTSPPCMYCAGLVCKFVPPPIISYHITYGHFHRCTAPACDLDVVN